MPPAVLQVRLRLCALCADLAPDPCAVCRHGRWPAWEPCEPGSRPLAALQAASPPAASPRPPDGPGTRLTALLSRLGLRAAVGCRCKSRAAEMDRLGPDWCEQNIDEIVAWLREEAKARRLPFLAPAARLLVRVAIAQARRNAHPAQGR